MKVFSTDQIINGRFFSLWLNGDLHAEVKTASAESTLDTEKVNIAGQLGSEEIVTGASGAGSMTFHKVFGDLGKEINQCIKDGKPFIFDLISELYNPNTEEYERVVIENCKITKFKAIDADISKLLESSYDFTYNPNNVTFE